MSMATVVGKVMSLTMQNDEDIPQWKKDLIARLRNQNRKNEERLLWIEHHPPHHHHHALQAHHPHPKTDLVCPLSPENGFGKDRPSPESSDSEDLHYGPGIVNKLRNKYLSLALRESNSRPSILRKATSLENLLDEDEEEEEEEVGKEDGRLFRRRGGGNDGGSNLNRYRSSNRRQDMKRARSVETISRTNHDDEMAMTSSVTAKINNRQSLHEEILVANNVDKGIVITDTKSYKKAVSIENGAEDTTNKYNGRINRPKRIPPLLNEREKPPVDVVKHAKLIFEKKPETRTKKPPQTGEVASKVNSFNKIIVKTKLTSTVPWRPLKPAKPVPNGDVAAKVDSFNNIIVQSKSSSKVTKPPIKSSKPVLNDKPKNNTQHHARPVAKPVILSEEMTKPKSLNLKGSRTGKKDFNSLPSPIPDVSRVDIKNQDGSDPKNGSLSSLCETPDLILTSSPILKITSPTYRKRSTQSFLEEERNSSFLLGHSDATNRYISPVHSPTKPYTKPSSLNFNKEELDVLGMRMISPISQKNITKNSATSVFNFINSHVDQNHLPAVNKNVSEQTVPVSEPLKIEVNGFGGGKPRMGLSAFEIEKNQKNAVKSGLDGDKIVRKEVEVKVEVKTSEILGQKHLKPVSPSGNIDTIAKNRVELRDDSEIIGKDVVGTQSNVNLEKDRKIWQHIGAKVEKPSHNFENHSKPSKNIAERWENMHKNGPISEMSSISEEVNNIPVISDISEKVDEPSGVTVENIVETTSSSDKSVKAQDKTVKLEEAPSKNPVKTLRDIDKVEKVDYSSSTSQNKSASVKNTVTSSNSEESPIKVVFPKKTKPRVEDTTSSVFNFTTRKDVPDYIANDKSRTPSRIVLPKPDEPGIKLLPEALLANFKEIQEVWEEDELIRSLEARPPSPCDITFINDNILIDGKSSLVHRTSKRPKLQKISFVDDADVFEYPSETSLLLEVSPLPSPLGGAAQLGHTVPTLSGSTLATYTPKTTETFQLGITKTFHEPPVISKPDVADVQEPSSDLVLEEVEQPVLFSSGSTSDILF